MKNPYAFDHDDLAIKVSRRGAYWTIYLFLLLITLPPLYRNLSEGFRPVAALFKPQSDEGIVAHLKAFEGVIEDAPFTEPVRRVVQTALTRGPLHEGNTKTLIGRGGWLYFKTALDALTGYGPLRPEPDSVAKDPRRPPWRSPLAAVTTFAAQLAETDTGLLLVPIPVKPMIYPEHLGLEAGAPLAHPDAAEFYQRIADLENVEVLDLAGTFWDAKSGAQLFLKQDTHWTPAGMQLAAEQVAARIAEMGVAPPAHEFPGAGPESRRSRGDLVEKLGIGDGGFGEEAVEAAAVEGATRDENSPIVLLGDSFTNIYADAVGLSWGASAGFAEHLAARLGTPLDVIAINGGGASEVREALAKRRGAAKLMRDKKLVVWAIATRDLFLSETAAGKARVEWRDVTFDTRQPQDADSGTTEVRAKLVAKSKIDNPQTTSYTALLYAAEYELLETLSGEPPETEDGRFLVLHWAFKDRKLLPSADYQVGAERSMKLVPFESQAELKTLEQSNQSDLFVDLLWELTPDATTAAAPSAEKPSSPILPASGCALFAALLGFGLLRHCRRSEPGTDDGGQFPAQQE